MPVFAYRGLSSDGRSVAGVVDADSARNARGKLRSLGIFPTDLSEERDRSSAARTEQPSQWITLGRKRVSTGELALLTRQLGALLGAGVQLVDALGTLADQSSRSGVKRMLSQVRERVREGSPLADALAAHSDVFSPLYVGMVRAGETAGALEVVLDRLADYNERQAEFMAKVKGALTYPIIMMCVGAAIISFLVVYVVPQVATIFQQNKAALPIATRILIGFSKVVTQYWLEMLSSVVAVVAAIAFGLSTRAGRRLYDRWLLRTPYLGPTVIRIICARFSRTLATLLSSGVQLLPALDAAKGVVTNGLLADAVSKSRESIRQGQGMGQTLSQSGLFPALLVEMIKVGERSGELEKMLDRVAENYEREVSTALSQMTTLLEPIMTILMGGVIVFMMLSVLLPIFQLDQIIH